MDVIVGILAQLKIDSTIWIQLGGFIVTYIILSELMFKPYYKAHNERVDRTIGDQDSAVRILQDSEDLYGQYETEARKLNVKHKEIYDLSRTEAVREFDRIVNSARSSAQRETVQLKERITKEVNSAKAELKSEIPKISSAIAVKLLGGESSL